MPTGRRAPALHRATVRRFWVVVLAALCVLVAARAGPWEPAQRVASEVGPAPAQDGPVALPEEPPPADRPPADPGEPPADLTWVRRALVVAVAAVLLLLLVRWGLRQRLPERLPPPDPLAAGPPVAAPGPEPEPDLDVLRAGARAAAEHLRADSSPADVVIAAWVALEEAAARSGVTREPSATPTEFALRVLDRTSADPAATRTLLGLYLRARFDDLPLGGDDVAVAADAARALVGTVGDPAPRQGATPPVTPPGRG